MSDVERWLPVPGFEGTYEVSDQGRVRSLPRRNRRVFPGKVLKTYPLTIMKYPTVNLGPAPQVQRYVHQLVLEVFIGPRPEGMEACHDNGDPTDNRLVNLRWDTHNANVQDMVHHGKAANQNTQKSCCPKCGGPYTVQKNGWRKCKPCHNAARRKNRQRKRQASA